MKNLARRLSIFLLALLLGTAVQAGPHRWNITDLGALGSRGSIALTMNDRGDIGGYSAWFNDPGLFYFHAFVWQNGTMVDIGQQLGDPPGFTFSQVSAINNRGTMVVVSSHEGVMLYRDGLWSRIGFLGGVADINKYDHFVGTHAVQFPNSQGYVYRDGTLQDIPTLGGSNSSANAISDKGVIVGSSLLAGDSATRGYIFKDNQLTMLGTLGGASSSANDINMHGVVVGNAQDASGAWRAYVQDARGMRAIPGMPADSNAVAINDRGTVLGTTPQNSFVFEDGDVTLLESIPAVKAAGWVRLFAMAINNHGWITGWGWKQGGNINGHAFVLKPK